MRIGWASDVGQVRSVNEDLCWVGGRLLIIADGMGGHAAGEVAAKVAVDTIANWVFPSAGDLGDPIEKTIRQAIEAANRAIYERAAQDRALQGMGTTLTMILVEGSQAYLGHVGDSRAYLFRDEKLSRLTEDHSVTAELVRSGGITENEANAHPYRHFLTRALGAEQSVTADIHVVDLVDGDGLLLCTDGLTSVLADADIEQALRQLSDPQQVADELVKQANQGGGPDNITVVYAIYGEHDR